MKIRAGIICLLLLLPAFSARAQAEIIRSSPLPLENAARGGDETVSKVKREVFDAAKYPALAAVGRINFLGGSWCSIILVSDDVAVTAGHCFLKANVKFDLKKDLDEFATSVNFKPDGVQRIEGVSVRRVLTAKMNPDYAIVQLNKKIPESRIKPLRIAKLTLDEMRSSEAALGCAAFNGDKELGSGGLLMTISRNIKILAENSSPKRVDTNCFSTYGGSGGLFYKEKPVANSSASEYDFLGVVWGLTDERQNDKGEWIKIDDVVTSITPVGAFYEELIRILETKERLENGKIRAEN